MHLFPTCGTKINTFLRLKLHRRRFCCANHNRTRGTPCRLPIVSFSLYHASFHLSLLNLQTGMGNYPFSLFTLPQILRWPRVVFLPVFASDFSRSTKPAPPSFGLAGETGQHRPSPAPWCTFPHPLQNRVPRVQVLLPLPIHLSPGLAKTAWPGAFSCLCLVGHGLLNPALCCIRCCPPASVLNRFLPLFSPPAPKTHPVSPFLGFSGCV